MKVSIVHLLALLFLFVSGSAIAQSTVVAFRVNMNHLIAEGEFNPATETVDLAGSFNGWGSSSTVLNDADNDGIYTTNLSLIIGTSIEFKARINGQWNGREEFPGGGPNRSYTVEDQGILEFWYSDLFPADFLIPSISASSAFVAPGETVRYTDNSNGEPIGWQWSFPGGTPATSTDQNPLVTYAAEGRYDVDLTIWNDSGDTATQTFEHFMRIGNAQTFWWNDAVWYEIFVRSFQDSDGDGRGDFQGLIDRLDYLNDGDPNTTDDLGINGIWLMPIQQSPSYHGYDVTDYRTVEADYGTNADFLAFMDAAHQRGIKVIIDLVMNHSSSQHPWFLASQNSNDPKRDWYVWEPNDPGTIGPWGQDVWHQSNGDYYYGVFWGGMPDMNYNNQEVRDEFMDITTFWLDDMQVDGFRLDAVKFLYEDGTTLEDAPATLQFWKDYRAHYKSVNPDAFAVGEAWTTTDKVQQYVNDDGLDYCFEFDLAGAMLNAVISGEAAGLPEQLNKVMAAYPYLQFGTFLTNHDIDRVMSVLNEDERQAKLAAHLLLTVPGIPYIYYGEEIGMTGVKPDPDIRKPMPWDGTSQGGFTSGVPWNWLNSDYTTKNVEAQQDDPNSLWTTYRDLIAVRNESEALRQGNYRDVTSSHPGVMAFMRQTPNEDLLIAANLGDSLLTDVQLTQDFANLLPGDYELEDLLTGMKFPFEVTEAGGFVSQSLGDLDAGARYVFRLNALPLSVAEWAEEFTFTAYPVPATDQLNLRFNGSVPASAQLTVRDLLGRPIYRSSLNGLQHGSVRQLAVDRWATGTYIVELTAPNQTLTKRVVVQ